jgi:hypothetical protein
VAIITFEPEFRPALPCVFGAKDYQEFRADLIEADRILTETGLEERLIASQIASYEKPFPTRLMWLVLKTAPTSLPLKKKMRVRPITGLTRLN